ncbi:MAG: outer membrane beta-barrel protein [Balneolaceae bacterium]
MSSKLIQKITVLFILTFGITLTSHAQTLPEMGSLGIRANIGGQTTIEMPYMMNRNLSLAPYLGFSTVENFDTNFSFGVKPRYYTGISNAVAPYFTGTLGMTNRSIDGVDTSETNFTLGAGYGAEYFFSDKFSVSADANLNARFGDNANTFGTEARVSASIYF